ncbi:extracellular solute-binding protein [Litorilinea aerophila]|nr:extracellular solute-binding protein [Litorilinea aerophila]MCC9077053.1 extracellular solute-binding protein [Litorilinea aerophila]
MSEQYPMSRRSFLKGVVAVAGGLTAQAMVAACTPAPAPNASVAGEAPANQQPAELSFMTWWLPPLVIGTAVENAVNAFNQNHPDIQVQIEPNPGSPDAQLQKWQTLLAAGNPPDMTLMRPHYHSAFASRGAFLQIDELLDGAAEVQREDFWPQTLDRLSWNGKLWGLPAEIWFSFVFLNLDMFKEAGVEFPNDDWTWDDYLNIATQLTSGEGVNRRFGTSSLDPWWVQMVRAWGGEVLDETETSCLVDVSPAPEAIQWTADLINVHKVAPSAENLADQNVSSLFETGRIGMHESANWYLSEAMNKFKGEWGIAPNPIGPNGRQSIVQGANYAIFKQTNYPDAAWTLMLDMSVGNGQQILLKETGIFPTVRTLATLDYLPNYEQRWIDVSLMSAEVARPDHFVPKYVEWSTAARKELDEVWVGRKTAKEAAEAMCPVINEILAAES